jgi:phospholipid/cholesterol/gamma-HCH transport system substrate-binding protein
MEERDKKTELLVGLFLTVGLLMLGLLILQFGSVRELIKDTYEITVPFADGTGIKDGTPVMLGGSKVGKVPRRPKLNANFNGVTIALEIYENIRIPADAKFGIGTAGLLGDSYVEIRPTGKDTQVYIEPGTVLTEANVAGPQGLSALGDSAKDLSEKATEALQDIRSAVADMRVSLKKINDSALGDENMKELQGSFTHLRSVLQRLDEQTINEQTSKDVKEAVASFKDAAKALDATVKKLDPAVAKMEGVVEKADAAMVSADKAMKSIDDGAASLGKIATDIRKGDGLLPALIYDRALKNEFTMLITNLRQRGVLWYKDKAGEEQAERPETKARGKR